MLYRYKDYSPVIEEDVFIASGCKIIGRVTLKSRANIWYNTVIRGDIADIVIGKNTNVQENSSLHVDHNIPLKIGDNVTVGHGAILHSCEIRDNCLIGMGATILNNTVIGENSIIGANALVPEGKVIPPGSLVLGVPGKIVKELTKENINKIKKNAEEYLELAREHQNIELID
ncbi:MAG: gamma carbonic anhydrase family protein [Halanaerobiales bacterium]